MILSGLMQNTIVMDYGVANRKHLESNANASNNKRVPFKTPRVYPGHGIGYSDSSDTIYSSSSPESSSDDFVQVNPKTLPKFKAPHNIPKPHGTPKSSYKNEKFDVSSDVFYRMEDSINECPNSIPQFLDITHESLFPSPILSPPVQEMIRPGPTIFDPDRIPSSIFSKPSTPTEWSIASNDSLFSIQIGNSSFSRDHIARMGYKSGELLKSGELYKSGELCMAADVATPCEFTGFRRTSPTAKEINLNKDLLMEMKLEEDMNHRKTGVVDELINDDVATVHMNNRGDANANRYSDKGETNIRVVVIPKKKKSSCCCCKALFCCKWSCFSCKWTCCCFKRSSCSCKWLRWPSCSTNCCKCPSCPRCKCPSCHSCKCPSCHSCKCPSCHSCKWPSCLCCNCHSLSCSSDCCSCWKREQVPSYDASYIVRDRGLTGSEKVHPEPQCTHRLSSIMTSTRKQCSCFSCTSSCSCCSF